MDDFSILPFPAIFCNVKIYLSGNAVWPQQASVHTKLTIYGILQDLLITQNVNNVERDFSMIFKHRVVSHIRPQFF